MILIQLTLQKDDVQALKDAAFALETVAHLQGHEQLLLPVAQQLRDMLARIKEVP